MKKQHVPEKDLSRRAILDELDVQLREQTERLQQLEARTHLLPSVSSFFQHQTPLPPSFRVGPHSTYNLSELPVKDVPPSTSDPSPPPISGDTHTIVRRRNVPVLNQKDLPILKKKGSSISAQKPPTTTKKEKSPTRTKIIIKKSVRTYNPNYTWDRGGRMKELRTRYRARKYLYIWIHRTFGNVLPSQATLVYHHNLLHRVFTFWSLRYWTERREPRLLLRGQSHYNFRLVGMAWDAWRCYMAQRKAKEAQLTRAADFHSRRLVGRALVGWREAVAARGDKRQMVMMGLAFRAEWLLKRAWKQWTQERDNGIHRRRQLVGADHVYSQNLQRRALTTWQLALAEALRLKALAKCADQQHGRVLKVHVFKAWRIFVFMNRRKKGEQGVARQFHHSCLLRQHFTLWREGLVRCLEMKQFTTVLTTVEHRAVMRRVIMKWKFYVEMQKYKIYLLAFSQTQYNLALKRRALFALMTFKELKDSRRDMKKLAALSLKRQILRRSLSVWQDKMEAIEERKLGARTGVARAARRKRCWGRMLLRRSFSQLKAYTEHRRQIRDAKTRAQTHFNTRTMAFTFHVLYQYTQARKQKRILKDKSEQFQLGCVLTRYWRVWTDSVEQMREDRYHFRVAVLHDSVRLAKHAFTIWKQRMSYAARVKDLEIDAVERVNKLRLRRCLVQWQQFTHVSLCKKEAHSFRKRHLARNALLAWHKHTVRQKEYDEAVSDVRKRSQRLQMTRLFAGWRDVTVRSHRVKEMGRLKVMARVWASWIRFMEIRKVEKEKEKGANQHLAQKWLGKTFKAMCEFSKQHRLKKMATAAIVQRQRRCLDENRARRFLNLWSDAREREVLQRLTEGRACVHWGQRVLRGAVKEWRSVVIRKQNQRLLKRQADWFAQKSTLATFWVRWRVSLSLSRVESQLSSRALWHWSISLEARVWMAWRHWTRDRRCQKERERAALTRFREGLVREALRRWTLVAWERRIQREKATWHNFKYLSPRQISVAFRCAIHWYHSTRLSGHRGLTNRSHPTPLPSAAIRIPSPVSQLKPTIRVSSPISALKIPRIRPQPALPDFLKASVDNMQFLKASGDDLKPCDERLKTYDDELKPFIGRLTSSGDIMEVPVDHQISYRDDPKVSMEIEDITASQRTHFSHADSQNVSPHSTFDDTLLPPQFFQAPANPSFNSYLLNNHRYQLENQRHQTDDQRHHLENHTYQSQNHGFDSKSCKEYNPGNFRGYECPVPLLNLQSITADADPKNELIKIKEDLKRIRERKNKLKRLMTEIGQLKQVIGEQESYGQSSILQSLQNELEKALQESASLQEILIREKLEHQRLVSRAQELTNLLLTS